MFSFVILHIFCLLLVVHTYKVQNIGILDNKCFRPIDYGFPSRRSNLCFNLKSTNQDKTTIDISIFKQAVSTRNAEASVVKEALQDFDQSIISVQNLPKFFDGKKNTLQAIKGDWELVFATLWPLGYLPIREIIKFYPAFTLDSSFLGIPVGKVRGMTDIISEKYPIIFNLTTLGFSIGPIDITYESNKVKSKSYTFLYVDETICIARSGIGGYSLFKRNSFDSQ